MISYQLGSTERLFTIFLINTWMRRISKTVITQKKTQLKWK